MREIKFRAWDSEAGEYSFSTTPESNFYAWAFDEGELRYWSLDEKIQTMEDPDPIELRELDAIEQFTGLLDKRGVEIYEGDILQWYCQTTKEYWIGSVVWLEHAVAYGFNHKHLTWRFDSTDYVGKSFEFEVIGNVHENKDLLND